MHLNHEQIRKAFLNAGMEGNHNFLMDDLVKLANSFIKEAEPIIAKKEREECVAVVRSLNTAVADKLEEVRGK